MQHFFTMGGYGFYVWTAYGVVFAALGYNLIRAVAAYKQAQRHFKKNHSKK